MYMAQPQGYIDSSYPQSICKLHKSIYGLKQAPRAWFESFTTQLLQLGFIASAADSSLFIYHHHHVIAYLLLYVDDIVLTSNSTSFLDSLILQLRKVFDLKDLVLCITSLAYKCLDPLMLSMLLKQSMPLIYSLSIIWLIPR